MEIKSDIIKYKRKTSKRMYFNLLYLLPLFMFMFLFLLMPFVTGVVKSFYRYDAVTIDEFIGIKNYVTMFTKDLKFLISVRNLVILLIALPFCFSISLIAAKLTLLLKREKTKYLYRTLFFLPMAVPGIVTLLMWKFMYYPEIGVFSNLFRMIGAQFPNVLGTDTYVLPAIILIGFPWVSGFNYIVILAALQGIDQGILEAAKIDGASRIKTFIKVELPLIAPQIKTLMTLAIIGQIQDYERFLILTNGGPNGASLVPGLHMYQLAFNNAESQYGYSCAIAIVLFIVTLTLSLTIMRRKENK